MRNDIKARRAERRWSQAELGKALGVSRQTVIAIENDKYDPSLPLAFAIARDRKSTRLNSSHPLSSRMPSSA